MKATVLSWRRTAVAVGIVSFLLTGWIIPAKPGSSGIAFFAWFMVISTVIVGALTLWLVPRSRKPN